MEFFTKPDPRDAYKRVPNIWGYIAVGFGLAFFCCGCYGVAALVNRALLLVTGEPVSLIEAFQAAAGFTAFGAFQLATHTGEGDDVVWKGFFYIGLLMFALATAGHLVTSIF